TGEPVSVCHRSAAWGCDSVPRHHRLGLRQPRGVRREMQERHQGQPADPEAPHALAAGRAGGGRAGAHRGESCAAPGPTGARPRPGQLQRRPRRTRRTPSTQIAPVGSRRLRAGSPRPRSAPFRLWVFAEVAIAAAASWRAAWRLRCW
ncbi:unnamed protein product, partial [Effrenium voratum]